MTDQIKPGDQMAGKAKTAVDAALKDARAQSLVSKAPAKATPSAKD